MTASVSVNDSMVVPGPGQTLFECSESAGVRVPTSCNKKGKCRECLVEIETGHDLLTAPSPEEAHLRGNFRLACRTRLVDGAVGEVRCHTLRRGSLRIETESRGLGAGPVALDSTVTRHGETIRFDGAPIASGSGPLHGLAIDVGTTTVVIRLHDLETGRLVATQAFENPQRFGGSDVMARIRFDGEHHDRLLHRTLLGYLSRAIESLPVEPATIYHAVVVGNPTMRDLFFGLDVQPIGQLPYQSVTEAAWRRGEVATTAVTRTGRTLRLPICREARVEGLPVVASHVGADAAALLLATGLFERDEVGVVMDIGTNTEVIIGNRERLMAASCPAGPAFEGGGVRCGMPALDGAIERVAVDPDGGVRTEVIGGGVPLGICGSGLVDLLAELRRTEAMNAQGRLVAEEPFQVDPRHGIALDESDINELAQAKGANAAGVRALVESYGLSFDQIDRFWLAGGFSAHLDLGAARRIGLIPDLPDDKLVTIGNAALEGASIALVSRERRRALETLVTRIEHVRLEAHPKFFDLFVEGCQFEPFGSAAVP